MTDLFNPAEPGCWIARGRQAHQAEVLADVWRRFPDLPNDAPPETRMARTRERVTALQPFHDAIRAESEMERQSTNFAFAERQIVEGSTDPRYPAILRGRNEHGYDWNSAWSYAEGFHAARAGWNAHFSAPDRGAGREDRRRAYFRGFADGGGDPDDIFDAARRTFAASVASSAIPDRSAPTAARVPPSQWPIPDDAAPPVSWHRRLLILSAREAEDGELGHLAALRACTGYGALAVLLAENAAGLRHFDLTNDATGTENCDRSAKALFDAREFDDILLAVGEDDLPGIDALVHQLPLARTMERTRNSDLQRRAQFRIWLARARAPDTQHAAGHIRWGKTLPHLSGRLGEFTARYGGPATPRGHRIIVEDASGDPARGYFAADGRPLDAEITITNRAHLRTAMTGQLRAFAASLRF
jgi:hypothetical protein